MEHNRIPFEAVRDGLTIRGHAYVPNINGPMPALIMSHGFMDNHQGGPADFVETGVDAGYAVFAFDFCGGCVHGSSDGKTTDMSVLTEVEDLKAVIAKVRSLPYIDPSSITLMGQSQGGFVSAITAAQDPSIEQIILMYPAFCIPDHARRGSMMFAKFDPHDVPEIVQCGPMKLGRMYVTDVIMKDPYEMVDSYTGRVLLIHGTEDRIVDVSYAKEAAKAYERTQPKRLTTVYIEGADHGFKGKDAKFVQELMKQFLTEQSL